MLHTISCNLMLLDITTYYYIIKGDKKKRKSATIYIYSQSKLCTIKTFLGILMYYNVILILLCPDDNPMETCYVCVLQLILICIHLSRNIYVIYTYIYITIHVRIPQIVQRIQFKICIHGRYLLLYSDIMFIMFCNLNEKKSYQ